MARQCPICGGDHLRGEVAVHLGQGAATAAGGRGGQPASESAANLREPPELRRFCRVCGCSDDFACEVLGIPCCWIEEDLCSACATVKQLIESEDAGWPWLLSVLGEHAGRVLMDDCLPYKH